MQYPVAYNIEMSKAIKRLNKFDELFDLAKFLVTLSLPLLSFLFFLTPITIRIKLPDNLVDEFSKNQDKRCG